MKVFVAFDFPGIDPDEPEADFIIDSLSGDLEYFAEDYGHLWYIDDAVED